jgi:hypothetical protein
MRRVVGFPLFIWIYLSFVQKRHLWRWGGGGSIWNIVTHRSFFCLEITQILCYETINLVC